MVESSSATRVAISASVSGCSAFRFENALQLVSNSDRITKIGIILRFMSTPSSGRLGLVTNLA